MSTGGTFSFDALLPAEMAEKAELSGVRKAHLDVASPFTLSVLAGAFIALGAVFATSVVAGSTGSLPYGVVRLLAGLAFSLGLILVVVGGAELFTGNNLIVMAWASRRVSTGLLLRNWLVVYVGNFVGAIGTAILVYLGGHHTFGNGTVGLAALSTANAKSGLGFVQAVALGKGGEVFVLDPWIENNPAYPKGHAIDRVDAILITHGHYDHFSLEDIADYMNKNGYGRVIKSTGKKVFSISILI